MRKRSSADDQTTRPNSLDVTRGPKDNARCQSAALSQHQRGLIADQRWLQTHAVGESGEGAAGVQGQVSIRALRSDMLAALRHTCARHRTQRLDGLKD